MRDKLIFAVVAAVLIGAGVAWFLHTYERVDVDERGPQSAVVRANPNYGFSRFLEHYGIDSRQLSTLNTSNQLPDPGDTLVIGFDAVYLSEEESVRIASWVAQGGHLVLPLPYNTQDTLLAYFNIHSGEDDEDDAPPDQSSSASYPLSQDDAQTSDEPNNGEGAADSDDSAAGSNAQADAAPDRYVYDTRFNGAPVGKFSLGYKVYDDLYSNRETLWQMQIERENADGSADRRVYALGFQYGLGAVSLLSDYAQWNNGNFHRDDNALVSLAALSQVRPPGTIWFVQTIRRASLWQLIWTNAAHVLMWLALAVILFFWWAGQRIGRVLPNPSLERREFNEHLIASGRYLWRNKRRDELLHSAQQALRERARQRYPRLYALDESQADLHLQELLEEHHETWVYAMRVPDAYTKPQFLEQIKAIQKLWKLL